MRTSAPRSSHGGLGRMDPVASLKGLLDRNAGLLVAAASALLCLPFVNSIWLLADEGIWLHAAQRMLDAPSHAERRVRSEEHTSELQSLMRITYAVFCLKKNIHNNAILIHTIDNRNRNDKKTH